MHHALSWESTIYVLSLKEVFRYICNIVFHPLDVVSRFCDPQHQVGVKFATKHLPKSDTFNLYFSGQFFCLKEKPKG